MAEYIWSRPRKLIAGMILLLLLLAGCQASYELAGTTYPTPFPAPDVTLDSAGGPVSLQDFTGQYTLLYFGYTFCPDVCPTTLATLKDVNRQLGEEAEKVQVVMITVDPERDTPESMAKYMGFFDEDFLGLTGTTADIDSIGEPFGLFYQQQEGSKEAGYLVDHTARVFLIDPDGQVLLSYSYGTTADEILQDIQHLIGSNS